MKWWQMNKRQKEIQQTFLDNEKQVLKRLEANYRDALAEINNKIAILQARKDADLQYVIYQIEYQKALKLQVQTVLDQLQNNNFETISEYLTKSYDDGFLGTMYDLQGQGIPLVVPIDQKQVVIAIQHETKLSEGLYTALGKDTSRLSKQIASEISRGISNTATYEEMTRNIASLSNIPRNNAARIARTEAHRIQNKATADAQRKAKAKGAEVVKQWDASLDGKTRDTHRQLDGQIRELDEPFEVAGMEAMQPGDFGNPAEDCNCRCCLLQRARWALGEDELNTLKERAEYFGLDKSKDFANYKSKYLKQQESERVRSSAQKPIFVHEKSMIDYRAEKVTFKDLQSWKKSIGKVTDDEYSVISGMNNAGYIRNANAYKINKAMRDGTVSELSDASKKTIETLKEVINKNESDMDAVLIRKVDRNYLKNVFGIDHKNLNEAIEELNSQKVGEIITEKGFVSTSYKEAKNLNNNDDVLLDIYAPKGTRMFLTKNREESEIILQAGTKFEFRGATLTDDNKIKLLVDVKNQANSSKTLENTVKNSKMKLSNIDVRKHYIESVSKIKDDIDKSLPIEEQAKRAFEKRNSIRTEARKLMADEETRKKLDAEKPNKTFEELVISKMERKGMTRREAIQDIYDTATKTNANVNKELGLGGD